LTGDDRGAPYRIDVPERWNRELVVLFHGYEVPGETRSNPMKLSETARALLAQGFALAQSDYAEQGWAPRAALEDNRRLRVLFEQKFGRPRRAFAIGGSYGGHLALAAAEDPRKAYAGVLSTCGVNIPAKTLFSHVVDTLTSLEALFPGVLPTGESGLDSPSAPATLDDRSVARLVAALKAEPEAATALARNVGVRPESLPATIWLYYAALRELTDRAGGFPIDNRAVRYSGYGDDYAFNRKVRRYAASPKAAAYLDRNVGLTGRSRVPVVLLPNAYDEIIPARFRSVYATLASRVGTAKRIVQLHPVGEGHCNFKPGQVIHAFHTLRDWANTGSRPPSSSTE
jgi:dienelactone hydrolase